MKSSAVGPQQTAVPLDAVEQTRSASLRAMVVLEIENH